MSYLLANAMWHISHICKGTLIFYKRRVASKLLPILPLIFILLSILIIPAVHEAYAYQPANNYTDGKLGVLVPLYSYPTSQSWPGLISIKNANPSVPMIAIINPDSGPGPQPDPNFTRGINSLRSAGIIVLGYVYTGYGAVNISTVDAEISDYKKWYGVGGIMFDGMNSSSSDIDYYSNIKSYASAEGFNFTVGDPGTSFSGNYIGLMNSFVVYEGFGLPPLALMESRTSGYPRSDFAVIAYGVKNFNASYLSELSKYAGWVYLTDNSSSNPYASIPQYEGNFVSELSSINSNISTSQNTAKQPSQPNTPSVIGANKTYAYYILVVAMAIIAAAYYLHVTRRRKKISLLSETGP